MCDLYVSVYVCLGMYNAISYLVADDVNLGHLSDLNVPLGATAFAEAVRRVSIGQCGGRCAALGDSSGAVSRGDGPNECRPQKVAGASAKRKRDDARACVYHD